MDRTERLFKLLTDLLIALVLGLLFSELVIPLIAWPMALLIAHTINFVFNAQPFVVLKHYGLVSHSEQEFEVYIKEIIVRLKESSCFLYASIHGSRARCQWRSTSDLDIILVRRAGLKNGLLSCLFAIGERSIATFSCFPLDLRVLDSEKSIPKFVSEDRLTEIYRDKHAQ